MGLVLFSWVRPANERENLGIVNEQISTTLALDASPSRQHMITAQVTEHPVETGAPATDYIRPMPRRLTVEGFITNTPIDTPPEGNNESATAVSEKREIVIQPQGFAAIRGPRVISWTATGFSTGFNRVQGAFQSLIDAITGGALFHIVTSLATYDNMAAQQMTVTETPTAADALNFSIEFQELRIVSTQTVAVPIRKAKTDAGHKTPANADADPAKKKALQSAVDRALFGPVP